MSDTPPKLTPEQVAGLCPGFSDITEIGAGGFKTVYRATIGEAVEVLKVISIPRVDGTEGLAQFREECIGRIRREVEILGRCMSKQLVKLASLPLQDHDVNGDCYVIYSEEFLDGPDLWKVVRAKESLPNEQEVKLLMKSLLIAIKEIWSLGYIHRDIKPANVIKLADSERPFVLIDLGIAFGLRETNLTFNAANRQPVATFRYMPPEMTNPGFRSTIDYRSDLYSAALTVFEYATGQHPIARDSDDLVITVSRAIHEKPKALRQFRSEFSPAFCLMVDQLLKKKPALRPANLDLLLAKTDR
jgi:eukaryotic-like serine/threonine-protein kinase